MSFREKTAWVTLIAILSVCALFLLHVPNPFVPHPGPGVLHVMGISLLAYVVIELVAYIVLRLRNPQDAREPRDEREKLIDLKALRIAYYVFAVGAIGGMFVTLHVVGAHLVGLGMVIFAAFVLSHVVRHAARIVYYRKDA